jgi:hypothetical protein
MRSPRRCEYCERELPPQAPEGLCPSCLMDLGAAELGLRPEVEGPESKVQSREREAQRQDSDQKPKDSGPWSVIRGQRFGDYQILDKIGEGGMGVVYKARQLKLDRLVAVKLLPFGQFSRAEVVQRFRAEAGEYAADMRLAQVAVADGDRSRALALLNKYRPKGKQKTEIDLRGWEWRYLWQLCQEDALETLHRFTNGIDAIAASPEGRRIAVLSSGEIGLWNMSQRSQLLGFHAGAARIRALSLTDDLLAISAQDTAGQAWIELRELNEAKVVNRLKTQTDASVVALSPDGKLLVYTDKEGGVWVLDSRSGQTLTNLNLPPTRTESGPRVTFSPDGSRLAIAEGSELSKTG